MGDWYSDQLFVGILIGAACAFSVMFLLYAAARMDLRDARRHRHGVSHTPDFDEDCFDDD